MNGKGDLYRPVDRRKWDEGYDRIFGRKKAKVRKVKKPLAKSPRVG